MWPAFPASDYYGGSAPSRPDRPTVDPAPAIRAGCADPRAGPGRFPCSLVDRSTKEAPGFTPAASPRLPRSTSPWPPGPAADNRPGVPSLPDIRTGTHRFRPRSARFELVRHLRGLKHRFLAYTSSSRSPDPHHLAVLARPGFVRAACHPPRHLPDRAAPSFTVLLRQTRGEGLSPPLDQQAPHGAPTGTHNAGHGGSPTPASRRAGRARRRRRYGSCRGWVGW